MIAECMIFLASFGAVNQLTPELLTEHKQCSSIIPSSMSQYSSIYVENFDEENLYTAMRIGWCESRGKQKAYRKSADDSGLMQFIPSTWNWIAEKFDAPEFDSKVLTYSGVPLRFLPEQDFIFDVDDITDKNERFLAAEIIREKIFRLTGDELPYSIAVEIENFEHKDNLRRIFAIILVDKDSQKPVVIGKDGEKLKRISTESRKDMEKLFQSKIWLEIWVKVQKNWFDEARALKSLGI